MDIFRRFELHDDQTAVGIERQQIHHPALRAGDGRDFGPDAAPRRRRPPAKRAAQAERGPKRPMYKRAAGPVRFSVEDDDSDEEEERGEHIASRRADASAHDTE